MLVAMTPAERPLRNRTRDPEVRGTSRPLLLMDDTAKAHGDGTNGKTHVPPLAPQDSPDPVLTKANDRDTT